MMTFQVAAAKCSEVGVKTVKSIHSISKVPDTVQNYGISANSCVEEVVTIKAKVWWLKLGYNPFNASHPGVLLDKSMIEELQSCRTILRKDKKPAIHVIKPGLFLLKGQNGTSVIKKLM